MARQGEAGNGEEHRWHGIIFHVTTTEKGESATVNHMQRRMFNPIPAPRKQVTDSQAVRSWKHHTATDAEFPPGLSYLTTR